MGSNVSRFNVSLSEGQSLNQNCGHEPQLLKTEKGEPKWTRTDIHLLSAHLAARPKPHSHHLPVFKLAKLRPKIVNTYTYVCFYNLCLGEAPWLCILY